MKPTSAPAGRGVAWSVARACSLAVLFVVEFLLVGSLARASLGKTAVPLALLAAAVVAWRWDGGGWFGPAPSEGRRAWRNLGAGVAWGAVVASLALGGLLITGVIDAAANRVEPSGIGPRLSRLAAYYALVALAEESFFRAYLLRTLARRVRSMAARVAIAAVLFAAIHVINPAYGAFAFLYAGALAVLLGAAFEITDSLSLCVGFHWAFNLLQDAVWQVPDHGGEAAYLGALAVAAVPVVALAVGRGRRKNHSSIPTIML